MRVNNSNIKLTVISVYSLSCFGAGGAPEARVRTRAALSRQGSELTKLLVDLAGFMFCTRLMSRVFRSLLTTLRFTSSPTATEINGRMEAIKQSKKCVVRALIACASLHRRLNELCTVNPLRSCALFLRAIGTKNGREMMVAKPSNLCTPGPRFNVPAYPCSAYIAWCRAMTADDSAGWLSICDPPYYRKGQCWCI